MIANQVPVFVVSAIAVSIGAATFTAYTYAFTFFQLPFGIVAVSVMTTIAPVLASRFTSGDMAGFAEQFGLGLRRMLAGVIPAVVGYLLLARPAISLISRGAGSVAPLERERNSRRRCSSFSPSACPDTASTCWPSAAFQAMRDTRTPFFLYLLENGLEHRARLRFRSTLGAKGLALSLSIAYSVGAVAALVVLRIASGRPRRLHRRALPAAHGALLARHGLRRRSRSRGRRVGSGPWPARAL